MSDSSKCAFCGGRISKERQISAATRGGDVRSPGSMHRAKYCSTKCRIETNWRKQAEKRAQERLAARAARNGKAKGRTQQRQTAVKGKVSKKQASGKPRKSEQLRG